MVNKLSDFIKRMFLVKMIFISLLLVGCAMECAGVYAATDNAAQGNLNDLQKIINRGTLIVAVPSFENTKLFSRNASGELQGYYIDVAKKIAQRLGVKVEFNEKASSFGEVVNLIAQGKADVAICHLSKTLERAKKILYTDTNLALHQTLLVNRVWLAKEKSTDSNDSGAIKVIQTKKAVIGTVKDSAYVEYAKEKFPLAIVKEYIIGDLLSALSKGEVDVAFYDELYVKELLQLQPGLNFKFRVVMLKTSPDLIAMAVPPGKWDLLYWLNCYIESTDFKTNADGLLREFYPKK